MKLAQSFTQIQECLGATVFGVSSDALIDRVAFDTRRIAAGEHLLFFALKGSFRDGHDFLVAAHDKGVRHFVVSERIETEHLPGSSFLLVENTLHSLQHLAAWYRQQFAFPVVGITGSFGKTIVKEWLYHFLKSDYDIVRSPKSYNSQLGVALSLLELRNDADLALIEAGISFPGEMETLERMIAPEVGIFTGFGTAHRENFTDPQQHLAEKLHLFKHVERTFVGRDIPLSEEVRNQVGAQPFQVDESWIEGAHDLTPGFRGNLLLVADVCCYFGMTKETFRERLRLLPSVSMRLESFDGLHGNLIINDTYNLDREALAQSLEYQLSVARDRKRVVILGLDEQHLAQREEILNIVSRFSPDEVFIWNEVQPDPDMFRDAVILIKGSRAAGMEKIAATFRLKKHKTFVEIDLNAMRDNIAFFRRDLAPETKMLAMVKASAYGNGIEKVGKFLQRQGIAYFGVAYADEGVEMRELGIRTPVLVMNAEEESFADCIRYDLEPAIYSFEQLDAFVRELIAAGKSAFPIHIKVDTGMRRLGFEPSDIPAVAAAVLSQPEIHVRSVYSHLADADNPLDTSFSEQQLAIFEKCSTQLTEKLGYHIMRHILNSEGTLRLPQFQFDMVRIGIGLYGISASAELSNFLKPVLSWHSTVSQVKLVKTGESVGYNRDFRASSETKIAIIPVGYADGFRRSLGSGKGMVFLDGKYCPVVGKVCMDMIMVDVTGINCQAGDHAELIGEHITLPEMAKAAATIPYEILTGISRRVHRVYIEE